MGKLQAQASGLRGAGWPHGVHPGLVLQNLAQLLTCTPNPNEGTCRPADAAALARRLGEAQALAARFAEQNERMASALDELRGRRRFVDDDYTGAPLARQPLKFRQVQPCSVQHEWCAC